jgi:hypothetical protein
MYITYLDLPALPKNIVDQIYYIVDNPIQNSHSTDEFVDNLRKEQNISASQEVIDAIVNVEYNEADSLGYPLADAWQHYKNLAYFDYLEANEEINTWVRENVDANVVHVGIQVMYNGELITPHVDEMRSYAYNYIIEKGGDPTTSFYTAKEEFQHLKAYPRTVFTPDRLTMIEETKIEPYRWHKIDTTVIHGVNNIEQGKKRISLSLSII